MKMNNNEISLIGKSAFAVLLHDFQSSGHIRRIFTKRYNLNNTTKIKKLGILVHSN